jgi:uncharacterized membrane protein
MTLLALGLLIWIGVHLFPSVAPGSRDRLMQRLGNAYMGIFALLILTGLVLIVLGWRSAIPTYFYFPPMGLRHAAMLVVVIGFVLVVAASFPTRIKRYIRHPQLTGVLLWALAHLSVNGDSRSILLFGAIAAWCLVSMWTINRRDGEWVTPEITGGWWRDALIPVIGIVLAVLAVKFHRYLAGIPLMT